MNEELNEEVVDVQPDELTLLKQRAEVMGISFHPNIGLAKLKEKIEAKTSGDNVADAHLAEQLETIDEAARVDAAAVVPARAVPTPQQQKMERRKKATRLVRIRITSMNPLKSNMKGEIFSAGNSEVGMLKKYVPFNAEDGWHVPQIILTMIKNKKFMTHYEVKQNGKKVKKNKLVPEYAIEILPPLTPKELTELKQRQLMAKGQ